jgi:hypothetical protein
MNEVPRLNGIQLLETSRREEMTIDTNFRDYYFVHSEFYPLKYLSFYVLDFQMTIKRVDAIRIYGRMFLNNDK